MSKKNKGGRKSEIEGEPRIYTVSTKLSEKEVKQLQEIAEYLKIPKMTLIRNMLLNQIKSQKK